MKGDLPGKHSKKKQIMLYTVAFIISVMLLAYASLSIKRKRQAREAQ